MEKPNTTDINKPNYRGPGSPSFRMSWLLSQLDELFPGIVNHWSSSGQDHLLIDAAYHTKMELAKARRELDAANAKLDKFRDLWHKYGGEVLSANFKSGEVPVNISLETSTEAWYSSRYQSLKEIQTDIIKILMD